MEIFADNETGAILHANSLGEIDGNHICLLQL